MVALWVAREHLSSMAYMVGVYGSILAMVGPSFVRIFIMWQGAALESYEGCLSSFVLSCPLQRCNGGRLFGGKLQPWCMEYSICQDC